MLDESGAPGTNDGPWFGYDRAVPGSYQSELSSALDAAAERISGGRQHEPSWWARWKGSQIFKISDYCGHLKVGHAVPHVPFLLAWSYPGGCAYCLSCVVNSPLNMFEEHALTRCERCHANDLPFVELRAARIERPSLHPRVPSWHVFVWASCPGCGSLEDNPRSMIDDMPGGAASVDDEP